MSDRPYVIQILWETKVIDGKPMEFWSPPIGPYYAYAEAKREATEFRKKLRRAGRPWHLRVRISTLADPSTAHGWLDEKIQEKESK